MHPSKEPSGTIHQLNSFLRGELSAVETYRQALHKLDTFEQRSTLEHCARSHEARARILEEEIRRRGGAPSNASGPWGAFVKLVEGGAAVFGEKAAIAVLEEGEDHGRDDYRRDVAHLDRDAQEMIKTQIIPEQLRTHQAMSALKRTLS